MKRINLKSYYGFNFYIDVSEQVLFALEEWRKAEHAANERDRYHSPYPLDWKIMHLIDPSPQPEEQFIQKLAAQRLHQALIKLPATQFRRMTEKYYFNLSIAQIAKNEGVSKQTVHDSISRAKKNLRKFLKTP